MSGERKRLNMLLSLPAISLGIALMSLVSSVTQSFNYARNIDSVQRNVLRAENLRTCKEIIDVFFQLRLLAEESNQSRNSQNALSVQNTMSMKVLAYKFGALGTFLANFRDEAVRQRYTELSFDLLRIANEAGTLAAADFETLYTKVDKSFTAVNDDCAHAAHARLL